MNETLLNPSKNITGMATNNPQNNINQLNSQPNQQIQANVNTPNNNQTNSINPITIPIQIQPQIAPTGQTKNINNQNNSSLQVVSNQSRSNL